MANALGRSKGEFQKGLDESTKAMKLEQTIQDMDAGGRTPSQALAARAKEVGINPEGMNPEELEKKVEEGPDVHPLAEMVEGETEKALFGDDQGAAEPPKEITPPKPKKKTAPKKGASKKTTSKKSCSKKSTSDKKK